MQAVTDRTTAQAESNKTDGKLRVGSGGLIDRRRAPALMTLRRERMCAASRDVAALDVLGRLIEVSRGLSVLPSRSRK